MGPRINDRIGWSNYETINTYIVITSRFLNDILNQTNTPSWHLPGV